MTLPSLTPQMNVLVLVPAHGDNFHYSVIIKIHKLGPKVAGMRTPLHDLGHPTAPLILIEVNESKVVFSTIILLQICVFGHYDIDEAITVDVNNIHAVEGTMPRNEVPNP